MTDPSRYPTGTPIADIDTPALIVDLDAFETNLDKMRDVI